MSVISTQALLSGFSLWYVSEFKNDKAGVSGSSLLSYVKHMFLAALLHAAPAQTPEPARRLLICK